MSSISLEKMKEYLSKSISSKLQKDKDGNKLLSKINRNKINGLLAEVELRNYFETIGILNRVSVGGWIVRCNRNNEFAHNTAVFFPGTIMPNVDYSATRTLPEPPPSLHTICSTFHQIGIKSYYCLPRIYQSDDICSIKWYAIQLGIPNPTCYEPFPNIIDGFWKRERKYNWLRYSTNVEDIPDEYVPEEFTKEHARICFQNHYYSEISDVDGIIWGERYTYPIEIKEKTPAKDKSIGEWFGLDVGPFVKLAFYAAKRGNLHSLYIVREIDNTESRNLVNWYYITFNNMAQYASWVFRSGGTSMSGARSATIRIPKREFRILTREAIEDL